MYPRTPTETSSRPPPPLQVEQHYPIVCYAEERRPAAAIMRLGGAGVNGGASGATGWPIETSRLAGLPNRAASKSPLRYPPINDVLVV